MSQAFPFLLLSRYLTMQRTEIMLDCLPCISSGHTGKERGALTLNSTHQSTLLPRVMHNVNSKSEYTPKDFLQLRPSNESLR